MTLIVTLGPAQGRLINARRPRHHTYLCTAGGAFWCSAWRMSEDRLLGEAAAVAFYSLLAVLPALAALASLFGLVADPQVVAERLQTLATPLPAGAAEMASEILGHGAARTGNRLGLGVGLAATALWTAMAAASQLFGAL